MGSISMIKETNSYTINFLYNLFSIIEDNTKNSKNVSE